MITKNNTIQKQAVLITGASTGIGRATALYLDKLGMKIYAGVRKESDAQKLKQDASPNLTPVILDVCNREMLEKAFDHISQEVGNTTFSLVNNAGLSVNGPLELISFSDINKVLDVNICGLLTVSKIFLPLIRSTKGRLVNISSGHGLLAIPDKSVYAASKFAVQAISDSLRLELRPFGVAVSNIVVGKINTHVLGKIVDDRSRMLRNAKSNIAKLYLPQIEYFDKEVKNLPGIDAIHVAVTISRALCELKPKAQYLVGPGAKKMKVLARFPQTMRDNMLYKAIHRK